jgi:hypothetical protein
MPAAATGITHGRTFACVEYVLVDCIVVPLSLHDVRTWPTLRCYGAPFKRRI